MSSTMSKRKRSDASVRSKRSNRSSSSSSSSSSSTATQTSLPSASQNDEERGRNTVHERLRSILMSPTSYTLFRGFNQKRSAEKKGAAYIYNSEMEIDGLTDPLPDFFSDNSEFKTLFSEAFKEAAGGCGDENDKELIGDEVFNDKPLRVLETDLTNSVIARLQNETEKGTVQFSVGNEVVGLHNEGRAGQTDFILSRNMQEKSKKIPVGLVEFGLLDDEEKLEQFFWEKMDHATRYLGVLRTFSNCWKWEKSSLLLGVLVATRNCSVGRLAVFACEPKGTDSWRMALLWRSQLESLDELSEAFGAFLNAADYLARDSDEVADKENITWEYLGPDCTKVQIKGEDYVARAYDNRAQPCNRTPRVYKDWDKLRNDTINLCLIQDNADSDNTLDFASKDEENELNDKSMLFSKWNNSKGGKNVVSKGGKMEVIAVKYQHGTHECTSFIQLLSLLYFVKQMHLEEWVHGDVRGRNTVFKVLPKTLKRSDFLLKSSDPQESIEIEKRLAKKGLATGDPQESNTNQVATEKQVANDPPLFAKKQLGSDESQVAIQEGSDYADNEPIAKDTQEAKVSAQKSASASQMIKGRLQVAFDRDVDVAEDPDVEVDREEFVYACLIDFDYGGKLGKHNPTYPDGYRKDLNDGIREDGNEGDPVMPAHDLAVIRNVLRLHELSDDCSLVADGLWKKLLKAKDLDQQIELAIKLFKLHPESEGYICPTETYANILRRYTGATDHLRTAKGGNKVTPDRFTKVVTKE